MADGYIMHKSTRAYDYVSAFVKSTPRRNIINRYEMDHNLFPIIRALHEDVRSVKASLDNLRSANGTERMQVVSAPESSGEVTGPYSINLPSENVYPTTSEGYE